ncbi:MAG TPA: hypothetical protein VFE31_13455 [Opitutaceae bacterium]|jgi:hypothetical protein|nr:hypothetical protein [Opitutaceae bacterium]
MQQRNNRVVGFGLAVVAFLIALPLPWLVFRGRPPGPWPSGFPLTVTSMNGAIFGIPIWVLLTVSLVTTVICALNWLEISSIPRAPILIVHVLTALCYLWPLATKIMHPSQVDVKLGPLAALIGSYLVIRLHLTPSSSERPAIRGQVGA